MDKKYEQLLKDYPAIGATMPKQVYDSLRRVDANTIEHLGELWDANVRENVKKYLPECGWINDGFLDIGKRKAIIAIGSGPSLKKNKDYLKTVSLADGTRKFEEQDFILMASNHELKSCFESGIIPHFAMVSDGSPDLAKQMDVGKSSRHTILIANIITSPDVIKSWKGPVKFACPKSDVIVKAVNKYTGKEFPDEQCVTSGGNVLNLTFSLGLGLFRASVWMCVGNDLSYPAKSDIKDRRKGYYADGDYSTNLESKRDEARNEFAWGGFKLRDSTLWTPKTHILWDLEWYYTASQLFLYKSWLETNCMFLWKVGNRFHVYNCTEGGILGVMLKEEMTAPEKYDEKFDPENWFLMDEITGGRWRTRTLWHACEEFHEAKQKLLEGKQWPGSSIGPVARYVADSARNRMN